MRIKLIILILIVVLTQTNFAWSQCAFGNYNFGFTSVGIFSANYIGGVEYYLPSNATISSLNLWGLGTNGLVQMALYQDNAGVPGNLLATSNIDTVDSGAISLPIAPLSLAAGFYWIMAIYDASGSTSDHTHLTLSSNKTVYYQSHSFGSPLPTNASGFSSYCCQDMHYWAELANVTGTDTQTACESFSWIDSIIYTSTNNSATYTFVGAAANGCDSLVTLDLTIINIDSSVSQNGTVLTANQAGGSYQWLDCDNNFSLINGETSITFTPSVNGNYAVEVSLNGCVDTSACFSITGIGIIENDFGDDLVIYPNPTNGTLTIDLGKVYSSISAKILGVSGQLMGSKEFVSSNKLHFEIEGAPGYYFVEIVVTDNKKATITILKE